MHIRNLILVTAGLIISSAAQAQAAKEVQDRHMSGFTTALDAYSAYLNAFAENEVADPSKSPELIADSAHDSCRNEYGKANDAAIIYTASTVPDRGKLQAVMYATQHMEKFKAEMRVNIIKVIAAKRSGGDT